MNSMPMKNCLPLWLLCVSLYAQSPDPPFYADRTNLLVVIDAQGKSQPIKSAADWRRRREHILANLQLVMGSLPEQWRKLPLEMRVLDVVELDHCTRKKITYRAEPEDWVTAYLLIPHDRPRRVPALLCLHQTIEIGKDEPAGLGGSPDLHYALELAERGYITLAPDYCNFGDYRQKKYDPFDQGYASGTMKGIWNHIRSIDLLQSLPEVDGDRIGCIGHSLGGHNTLWLAAFDTRLKVMVSSCGFNSMSSYAASPYSHGDLRNYAQRRYMPRISSLYGNDPRKVPFDWPEVLAALAPRPVFINAPLHDLNFVVSGLQECVAAAQPIYAWMGATNRLVAAYPNAAHSFPPEVRAAAYAFIDQALRK